MKTKIDPRRFLPCLMTFREKAVQLKREGVMTGDEDIQRVALYEALKKYDELKPMPPQDFADEWLGYYMDFRRKWLGFGLSRSGLAGVCLLVFVTLLSLFSGPAAVVALGLAEVFK